LGWTVGRNVQIVYHWAAGERYRQYVKGLVALAPDVIVGHGTVSAGATAWSRAWGRPGGNVTGVTSLSVEVASKRHWLLIKRDRLILLD
jgi:hypothetical protein